MKILCPIDFSGASMNAIEYASKFAQRTNASITLLHVQNIPMSDGVNYISGGINESVVEIDNSAKQMEKICSHLTAIFKVPCDIHSDASVTKGVVKTIAEESAEYDLTIIGTNGADNLSEFYLGSHSFRVAKSESGPVLIVPEECEYRDMLNIAFASDCHIGDTLLLQQLKQFTDVFNPRIRVVHISEKDTALSREVYRSFCSLTEDALNYDQGITFERVIHKNEAEAIESFMNKTNADLLALYMEKRSLLYRMFHESIIKKLSVYASFPILVFHR